MERILGRPIDLCLSGNLHHYRRHTTISLDPRQELQRITAGGGGAFLHPTHEPLHHRLRNRLECQASFPPPSESRAYLKVIRMKGLLAFPFLNWSFGAIPAVSYGLLSLIVLGPATRGPTLGGFAASFVSTLAGSPSGLAALALLALPVLAFRERSSVLSLLLATGHLAGQVAAALLVAFGALILAERWISDPFWRLWTAVGLSALGGWAVGSVGVGLYLWVSALCSRCLDFAYAALRIQDWKSFLRLRVEADGTLTIFPIGFQRVARRWARRTGADGVSRLEPEDPNATPPELIEMPIVIRPR